MTAASTPRKPTLLVILDGVGLSPAHENNAPYLANTPRLDAYFARYPFTSLQASGRAVGLPDGQMGNSEVGHTTIGCGSILKQDLVRIDDAIADGSFFENAELLHALQQSKRRNRPLHLLGLVSDGGVHSHIRHLCALIELCRRHGVTPAVHAITDGRDTPPRSAKSFIQQLLEPLHHSGGHIATVCGRYYAMDRDKRWDRVKTAWRAICYSEGEQADSALAAIEQAYAQGITDEFIPATVIHGGSRIENGDGVVFFNFRNDRSRQLTYILSSPSFKPFDRGDYVPQPITCMTEYDPDLDLPIAFPPQAPATTLGEIVSKAGLRQFHCAETEKYAHVTFFLNGGREEPFPGEGRVMVPSPHVSTYDKAPAMSAPTVADATITALESRQFSFVVVNFANGDMVGHTAVAPAVIQAMEVLDHEAGRLIDAAIACGYSVLLTADHGNCEVMVDPQTGQPHTQHTTNPVPCLLIDEAHEFQLADGGGLANIAPTVLQLMGLPKPEVMEADSLLRPITQTRTGTN